MKKITTLVIAAAIAIGIVATSTDTKTVAQVEKQSNEIMLANEVGLGGGAGWYIHYSCDDTVKWAVSLRVFVGI